MELQLTLAVLVLQIITIILLITGKKKQGRASTDVRRPNPEFRGEKKDSDPRKPVGGSRKPGDNRSGSSRPPQQNRPQPSQPAGTIDPMEKSLRDINLRLKNAEREQENARKKFQEGGNGAGNGRDGRDNRDGRPHQRGGNRNDRSGPRDFNRDQPRRENRPERPQYRSEQENTGFQAAATEQPVITPAAPDIVVNDIGVSEDQLQHGRKFTAKRRQLPSDNVPENGAPEAGITETGVPETITAPQFTESAPDIQDVQAEQQTENADIQFGRR